MTIKLSLICPVYKVAEYIPPLMQSLLEGVNNKNIEIIKNINEVEILGFENELVQVFINILNNFRFLCRKL